MSQPSSNVDAVIMAWSVREQAKSFPLTLWQRDSLAAAFSPDVVRQLRLGHQVQSIIAAKMTAQLQLTDTDFSAAFKALMRKEMGDLVWKGQEKLRRGGSGDISQAQVEDICLALHHCMEEMMKRNEERWWVLKGLRRNGWLAVRPNLETSRMEWVEEEWAEGMPLGSSRIPHGWLKQRASWLREDGVIEVPRWEKAAGATEVADLAEWSYLEGSNEQGEEEEEEPVLDCLDDLDWAQAASLQLSPELRRLAWLRGRKESAEQKDLAKRRREKRKKRAEVRKKTALTAEEKEEVKSKLQKTSRDEMMRRLVPAAGKKAAQSKKKGKTLSLAKKVKKQVLKKALQKAVASKAKKSGQPSSKPGQKELPPLPPPSTPPPAEDEEEQPAFGPSLPPAPPGTWRVCKEKAGVAMYGCQGKIEVQGEEVKMKTAKGAVHVKMEHLIKLAPEEERKGMWRWRQMSLSRQLKHSILVQLGMLSEERLFMHAQEDIEVVDKKAIPAGGFLDQVLGMGWLLLRWLAGDAELVELADVHMVSPLLVEAWHLHYLHQQDPQEKELLRRLDAELEGRKLFLLPICKGSHYTLLVVDRRSCEKQEVRYYDTLV